MTFSKSHNSKPNIPLWGHARGKHVDIKNNLHCVNKILQPLKIVHNDFARLVMKRIIISIQNSVIISLTKCHIF